MVQLLCSDGEGEAFHLSRAVALAYQPAGADFDILLATRHGVTGPNGFRRGGARSVLVGLG